MAHARRGRRQAPGTTGAALVAGTAVWNVLQNVVLPRSTYTWLNAAATGGVLAVGRRLGLTRREMGTSRDTLGRGLRVGAVLGAGAVAVVAVGVLASPTRGLFRDARAAEMGGGQLVYEAFVRIPLGTALFEETLFRGLLLGWFIRREGTGKGVAVSSVLFGLWHLLPTWEATALYQEGALRTDGSWEAVAVVVGGVAATAVAGAGLSWLRLRTGSLAAPVLVHAAINAAGLVAAWVVMR